MENKVNITIPAPCHENWQAMTVVDKGRFCASCQKKVIDFTKSSDSQIIEAIQKDTNLCGRFSMDQLDRSIEKPTTKRKKWLVVATLTSFLSFGSQEIFAQGNPVKIEKTDKKVVSHETKKGINQEFRITGTICDEIGLLPGARIINPNAKTFVDADYNGNFSIEAKEGDVIIIQFPSFEDYILEVTSKKSYAIELKSNMAMGEIVIQKRSFFGRVFHKISCVFKKRAKN